MQAQLSRRQMLIASGIVVTSLTQSPRSWAQQPEQKRLKFHSTSPKNGEPQLSDLVQNWITPNQLFYVRSHGNHPTIDAATYRLHIDGLVDKPLSLSLGDLQKLPEHTIAATLTCAGNRRNEFNADGKVGGVQWEAGAIGNASWSGVTLADVLKLAGVQETAKHVWFEGLDQITEGDHSFPFGASIPLEKTESSGKDVGALLCYKMNGQALEVDHGFPLRTIVPGYIGARSVKWLGKITLSDRTSLNHYVADAYKMVRSTKPLDWSENGPIYRYPINAAGALLETASVKPGEVQLAGYVLPSGISGAKAEQVMLSTDRGQTWTQGKLSTERQDYCWQLWTASVKVNTDTTKVIIRATDDKGGFMPDRVPWNAKGYLQNSWYHLPIKVANS